MDEWRRRGKRWQTTQLNAITALYGDDVTPPAPMPMPTPKRGVKRKSGRNRVEQGIQIRLVAWIKSQGLPVFAIPNEGKRSPWLTEILKACGLWPGACDLLIPVMRKGFGGFFVEMKSPGEKPRENQWAFIYAMREQGYKAEWYDNFDDAKAAIVAYLMCRKASAFRPEI